MTQALEWHEGAPERPGRYLFQLTRGSKLRGAELIMWLTEPPAYRWLVVDVTTNEHGWLLYCDVEGDAHVVRSPMTTMSIWWAELP